MLYDLGSHRVQTEGDEFFVAPSASVIGRVTLGRHANVWFSTVIRGDINDIRIGDDSNVQDAAVIHVDSDAPCTIGRCVTPPAPARSDSRWASGARWCPGTC